jgi:hypothetical protein
VSGALGAQPTVTPAIERAPFVWDEPQSQALYLTVDPRSCDESEAAVLALGGSGLSTKRFSSGPACDFGAAKAAGDYLAPWPKWRVEMDYGAWRFLDTKPICEEYDAASDEDVERCAQIGIYHVGHRALSKRINWSISVGKTQVAAGSARFVRSFYRKSRPSRTLKWFRFPRNGPYWGNETGPAPSGWWACRSNKRHRYWERPTYKPGLSGTELYGYWIYCQPPRPAGKYKTSVTILR